MLQHFCLVKNQVSCNPNTWMITRNLKYVELQIYYSSLYVGPAMSWWLVQAGPHFWPEGTWEKAQPPIHFKANGGRPNFGALHSTEYEKGVWTAPENAVCLFFFWLYLCDVCSIYMCAYWMIVLGQALVQSPLFTQHILGVLTSYFGKVDMFVCVRLRHDSGPL